MEMLNMKKSLLSLAVLGTLLASGSAMAQSSVTVYGVVDVGVAYKNAGAGTVTSLDSGLNSTSRLGFKGTETLADGLKVNFGLEMGIKADTGANDANLFARGAWVGFTGDLGEVNFGRHKSLTYIYGAKLDPFSDGLLGKTDTMYKINGVRDNSITYMSKSNAGFSFAAQYGFGEVAGNTTANRVTSLAGNYANGNLLASVVWDSVKDANGNKAIAGEKVLAGVVYDFGMFKAHALYQTVKGSTSLTNLTETKENFWTLAATTKSGPNTFMISYTDDKNKTKANADATRIALGYTYDLSKRTNLYASLANVKNDSTVKVMADKAGATAKLFNFGIRHKF